ncbi:phage recombination protein Bet [Erysipelothrix sp. HDW6C]|uniref:phage recombination protein Bet n=1 Tax=Erysipelothrix sp. HDW6C TaxID=2714930 RepID=UPI00140E6C56|nr:phage recombination protein Bet [Erysipelothrix sp. HDW6C]QIK70870.1 phage recombination protein Bet [Erysipelothrix sp. HDW6C]
MTNKLNDTNAVVEYQADGVAVKLTPSIVKNFLTGGTELSDPEYKFFVELCKARQLNPFLKEAYPIKFGNQPAQIVVGKDAILKRAIKHKNYNGREQGVIVINLKGEVEERKGTFKLPNEELVGGWAKVYRKDWEHPTYISVGFDEVSQKKKDGELNSNWASKGATMVEKVALVRALRETFVEDLGGMVDADEAWDPNELTKPKQEIFEQKEPIHATEVIDAEIGSIADLEQ